MSRYRLVRRAQVIAAFAWRNLVGIGVLMLIVATASAMGGAAWTGEQLAQLSLALIFIGVLFDRSPA